jgi:Tol biopolymer transport system component
VYVRDTELGVTTLVSVGISGRVPDGGSYDPAISSDGRYVVFASAAANLVAGDRNRTTDVFVRDLRDGTTSAVSGSARGATGNGPSGSPAISSDGRFVVFQSDASDLICARRCSREAEDINLLPDVFLFERISKRMTWISSLAAGGWAEESGGAQVDAAGDVVVFSSRHPVDEQDVDNDFDLFVRVPEGQGPTQGL